MFGCCGLGFGRSPELFESVALPSTRSPAPPSGNQAFDEYRIETLRRLEQDHRDFRDFMHRLRIAKDKAEFDRFMAERRSRPQDRDASPPPQ